MQATRTPSPATNPGVDLVVAVAPDRVHLARSTTEGVRTIVRLRLPEAEGMTRFGQVLSGLLDAQRPARVLVAGARADIAEARHALNVVAAKAAERRARLVVVGDLSAVLDDIRAAGQPPS